MVSGHATDMFVEASVRIPGRWKSMEAFREELPDGCELSDGWLQLPDGGQWRYDLQPADGDFRQLFGKACRHAPSPLERHRIDRATVALSLSGPAGSRSAVARIMAAVATVIRAGGAGVFIDNSVVAHSGSDWLEFAQLEQRDTGPYLGLISFVSGPDTVFTVGAHLFGCRDVVLPHDNDSLSGLYHALNFLRHASSPSVAIRDGDVLQLTDLDGYRVTRDREKQLPPPDLPMYNPFGRWRLEPPGC